ncbi:hypothetical protein EH223_00050 [candidate division KSB1 bacterium]|nr:hypothetical protein [candidate division KSB1 bacterium]RQW07403.1 MAG: hypothetical protein EH223_00050 [candidate division KSB1 bacterium]
MDTDQHIFYRRNLPHILPPKGCFFVTFRLYGSLPFRVLDRFIREKEKALANIPKSLSPQDYQKRKYNLEKYYFARFDSLLHKTKYGPTWLAQTHIADIVVQQIFAYDNGRYNLRAFCIMPNHVHLLLDAIRNTPVTPKNERGTTILYPLTDVLRLVKGSSATLCNRALGRRGTFWEHESYDHVVRNENEYNQIVAYIIMNPVKAGLVNDWRDWSYTFWDEMDQPVDINVDLRST